MIGRGIPEGRGSTNGITSAKRSGLRVPCAETRRHAAQSDWRRSFPPGSKLPSEAQLSEAHGVSRTVVREAIASLRADRLVEHDRAQAFSSSPHRKRPGATADRQCGSARVSSMIELLELRTRRRGGGRRPCSPAPLTAQEEVILERHFAVRACLRQDNPRLTPILPCTSPSPRPRTIPAFGNFWP